MNYVETRSFCSESILASSMSLGKDPPSRRVIRLHNIWNTHQNIYRSCTPLQQKQPHYCWPCISLLLLLMLFKLVMIFQWVHGPRGKCVVSLTTLYHVINRLKTWPGRLDFEGMFVMERFTALLSPWFTRLYSLIDVFGKGAPEWRIHHCWNGNVIIMLFGKITSLLHWHLRPLILLK